MSKILWFDTETTGVNAEIHGMIQIAGIIEVDGKIEKEFNLNVRPFPGQKASPDALKITGKTIDEIIKYPSPEKMYLELTEIFSSYIDKFDKKDKFFPAGYNVMFDIDFLNNFFFKNSDVYFGSWQNWIMLDPRYLLNVLVWRGDLKLQNLKLCTVCDALEIRLESAHDAMNDIRATRKVFYKCLDLLGIDSPNYINGLLF